MISVATSGVKVFKMWAGIFPAAPLWKSDSISHVFKTFYDEPKDFRRPLDSMIDKLIDCDAWSTASGRGFLVARCAQGGEELARHCGRYGMQSENR